MLSKARNDCRNSAQTCVCFNLKPDRNLRDWHNRDCSCGEQNTNACLNGRCLRQEVLRDKQTDPHLRLPGARIRKSAPLRILNQLTSELVHSALRTQCSRPPRCRSAAPGAAHKGGRDSAACSLEADTAAIGGARACGGNNLYLGQRASRERGHREHKDRRLNKCATEPRRRVRRRPKRKHALGLALALLLCLRGKKRRLTSAIAATVTVIAAGSRARRPQPRPCARRRAAKLLAAAPRGRELRKIP